MFCPEDNMQEKERTLAKNTDFRITNRHGDPLRGNVHLPGTLSDKPDDTAASPDAAVSDDAAASDDATAKSDAAVLPVVIICHGFKGFKDWGMFPYAADFFASHGCVAIRFNLSLNGIGEDELNFTQLENFGRNTRSRELDDLDDIVAAVHNRQIVPAEVTPGPIVLVGHSLGGGLVVVKASEDERISGVCSWSGVADFDRWGAKTKEQWRRDGKLEIKNARTGQMMPLHASLLDDLEEHRERFDISAAASRLKIPLLLIHGEQDVSVSPREAERVYRAADPEHAAIEKIPATGHTFDAVHPFQGVTPALSDALQLTLKWLRREGLA